MSRFDDGANFGIGILLIILVVSVFVLSYFIAWQVGLIISLIFLIPCICGLLNKVFGFLH